MKFSINRDLLLSNLNDVARALSTKPQMPILTGIKIDIRKKYIALIASNAEISIETKIPVSNQVVVEEEGTVVLPGKYLIDIVRKIDTKIIDFSSFEENMVKIITDRVEFTLNAMDKDNYPLISFSDSDVFFNFDVLNLKQIIKKTTFATSLSESRMILTGVSFSTNENKLETVATDGFRLAKKFIVLDEAYPKINVVIPSHSLDELNKIIDDIDESVQIHFARTKVLFKYKNILFQTRLIEGIYPNTNSLIPTEFMTSIKFNKQELISTIDRASLFTSIDSNNIIKLSLTAKKTVEIASTSNEIGAVLEEIVPLEVSDYVPFQIAFSAKYFLDAIRAFDSIEVTIHFTGEIKAFIITGEYDVNHLQLILPVRGA